MAKGAWKKSTEKVEKVLWSIYLNLENGGKESLKDIAKRFKISKQYTHVTLKECGIANNDGAGKLGMSGWTWLAGKPTKKMAKEFIETRRRLTREANSRAEENKKKSFGRDLLGEPQANELAEIKAMLLEHGEMIKDLASLVSNLSTTIRAVYRMQLDKYTDSPLINRYDVGDDDGPRNNSNQTLYRRT